jgi:hypothetical protein
MNLVDLQRIIDFCRENYDNWQDMNVVFQSSFVMNNNELYEEDIHETFVDEEDNILVFKGVE